MPEFKLDPRHGILFCTACMRNGRRLLFVELAVDTGASFTMISHATLPALGIDLSKSAGHREITTASGVIVAPIYQIPSFSCFGVTVKKFDVLAHDLPVPSPVEGLLGLDFLTKVKAVIDFSKNIISVPEP